MNIVKLSDLKRTGKLLFMHPWELGEDIAGYIITQKFVPLFNAFVTVLNWGLGPHEDQTAEMALIWSSFYIKVLIFPSCCIKLGLYNI